MNAPKEKKPKKIPFDISFEEVQKFSFSDEPIAVSRIADRLNDLVTDENMKKITHRNISEWLVEIGMLKVVDKGDGKTSKAPTEDGGNIGISMEMRNGQYGNYEIVVYNRMAQEFVVDNISAIIENIEKQKNEPKLTDEELKAFEELKRQMRG